MLEIGGIEKCFMKRLKSRSISFYCTKFPILIKGGDKIDYHVSLWLVRTASWFVVNLIDFGI